MLSAFSNAVSEGYKNRHLHSLLDISTESFLLGREGLNLFGNLSNQFRDLLVTNIKSMSSFDSIAVDVDSDELSLCRGLKSPTLEIGFMLVF